MSDEAIERPDRLVLYRFDELLRRPPSPWLVRGVLRESSVSLLYGQSGAYKTFVTLDLAASIASGVPWQDHEVVKAGLVIYIAAEGGGGMVQRARAWQAQHPELTRLPNLLFLTEPVLMTRESDDIEDLIGKIQDVIGWVPAGVQDPDTGDVYEHDAAHEWPVLIVIDTLARCFLGDENKPEDMGQFIQGVDRLKAEFNCSVLIVHHTGRDVSHERGHTSLKGACDTIYRLGPDEPTAACMATEGQLYLSNEKMKDGMEPAPVELAYRQVPVARKKDDEPGEDLTSVIIERPDMAQERKYNAILLLLKKNGPQTFINLLGSTGHAKTTLRRYLVDLRERGKILNENGVWALDGPRSL